MSSPWEAGDNDDLFEPDDNLAGDELPDELLELDDELEIVYDSPESDGGDFPELASSFDEEDADNARNAPFESETVLAFLLRKGDYQSILALTGQAPCNGPVQTRVKAQFIPVYANDVIKNRAIAWYSKLAQAYSNQFRAEGPELVLEVPPPAMAALQEFANTYRPALEDVSLIQTLAGSVRRAITHQNSNITHPKVISTDRIEDTDLKITDTELVGDDLLQDTTFVNQNHDDSQAGLGLGDDGISGDDVIGDKPDLSITLADLSNKAIAERLISEGMEITAAKVFLQEEGLDDQRCVEIVSIMRYLKATAPSKSTLASFYKKDPAEPDNQFNIEF